MPQVIVVFSRQRTGSTYLVDLLRESDQIDARGEIFSYEDDFPITSEELREIFGGGFTNYPKNRQIKLMQQSAHKVLTLLKEKAQKTGIPILFKVFPYQLDYQTIRSVILNDKDIVKVALDRDIISSYTSLLIAQESSVWRRSDTSKSVVAINEQQFLRWYDKNLAWYQFLRQNNAVNTILRYDDFIVGNDKFNFALITKALYFAGLQSRLTESGHNATLPKQYSGRSKLERISNITDLLKSSTLKQLLTQTSHFWDRTDESTNLTCFKYGNVGEVLRDLSKYLSERGKTELAIALMEEAILHKPSGEKLKKLLNEFKEARK